MRWRTGKSIRLLMYCALAICAPILFLYGCGSGGDTGASPGQQETAAYEQDGDAEGNAGAAADGSAGTEQADGDQAESSDGGNNGTEDSTTGGPETDGAASDADGKGSDADDSGAGGQTGGGRSTVTDILMPEASGGTTYQNDDGSITLDLSHTDQGYIMIRDTNDKKVQIQITNPTGEMYPYPMNTGNAYRTFPLTCGDGGYSVRVLENISGDQYAIGLSQDFSVKLQDEFRPFLYPNQYVEYTADSDAVKLGQKLSGEASDDLGYVQNVYNYVISNITYDTEMAENLPVNYIPDPDATLASGKGICFDYASLMTAMLRSQGVPTKLVTGYSGEAYHAWISVYLKEQGWVDNIISFDGKKWTLVDPTLGANNDAKDVAKYIGDGKNYTVKYVY